MKIYAWYFLVQYIDQDGCENRKEYIRMDRDVYDTDRGCWNAALQEIFDKKKDYEHVLNITLAARGYENKRHQII